ncbi:radical SAM protein [Myxococcota bacterium]
MKEVASTIFQPPTLVSTNGTLLTEHVVEEFASLRVQVQVSLDSARTERHDQVRGHGVYAKVMQGIRRLTQAGVYTILSLVYTRESVGEMEGYLDLAAELGANEARFIPLRAIGKGLEHQRLRPNQLAAFERLLDVLNRRPELARLLARDYFSILTTQFNYSAPRLNCGLGRKVLFVDADGSVYPCPNHVGPEYLAGNLREQTLQQIVLEAPVLQGIRQTHQVTEYTRCRTCPFRYWCAGDCRGEVVASCGDWRQPSPHCAESREVYRRYPLVAC